VNHQLIDLKEKKPIKNYTMTLTIQKDEGKTLFCRVIYGKQCYESIDLMCSN